MTTPAPVDGFGVKMGLERLDLGIAARVDEGRTQANERMAALFDDVDIVSVPAGEHNGLPIGMESMGREHTATARSSISPGVGRLSPWPLTARGV